ncbi:hypothetical protein AS188_06995 [Kocuria flava]|uniref:Uncharacterized protein n=1 Tax=Kocuria flava TaxID=446860 RepID=A0A0U3HPT0_9MICC|nr:hypothetical protein [Kocuria flava]ALU39542.1 hypothetical protein AS188_06995 [Kocuria flava]GEO93487.1 hypothetical protein KFL01_27930 [Kocuria flava]
MGLRGIFRKSTGEDAPRGPEQPHPGTPPGAPAGDEHPPADREGPRPLPAGSPLATLVERLTARGAEHAVLTLDQRGSTMTQQTEQSSEGSAPAVESGTVDHDSPLFDPVADLYSEAMAGPRGAWQRARIEVGPEHEGVRPVTVAYGWPDGGESVETWESGRRTEDARPDGEPAGDADDERPEAGPSGDRPDASGTAAGPGAEEQRAQPGDGTAGTAGGTTGTAPRPGAPVLEEVEQPGAASTGAGPTGAGSTAAGLGAAALAGRSEEPGTAAGEQAGGAPGPDRQAADERAGDERVPDEHAGDERAGVPAPADAHGVPDHVDHEEWHEDDEPAAPTGHRAAAGAAGEGSGASAPGTASRTDVPPSYRAHEAADERPAQDRLAQGNLVLAEADVLRRLADAQRRLFGEDGTAMDVSTVLVRVRALGTYYDALTHVRKNGFWDQRRTFDLVPEELLHVQELKDESYVEGAGSPLAMMFRFRPGIPPEVSFDYGDEEAFVRYEQRLPAQNYLEELRMYPRTGANIPQHMNEALQDWTY